MSIKWKREGGSRPRSFPFFSCVKLLLYTYNSSSELRSAKLKPFFLESYIAHSKLCSLSLSLSHTHTQTHTHTHTHTHTILMQKYKCVSFPGKNAPQFILSLEYFFFQQNKPKKVVDVCVQTKAQFCRLLL